MILDDVKAILEDRQAQYGDAKPCFERIATFWSAYLSYPITSVQVAHLMCLMKLARLAGNPDHVDCAIDVIGYLACAEKL